VLAISVSTILLTRSGLFYNEELQHITNAIAFAVPLGLLTRHNNIVPVNVKMGS